MTSKGICGECGVRMDLARDFGCPERRFGSDGSPSTPAGCAIRSPSGSSADGDNTRPVGIPDPEYPSWLDDSSYYDATTTGPSSDPETPLTSRPDRLADVAALLAMWQRYAEITDTGLPAAAAAYRRCCRELREQLLGHAESLGR